VNSVRPTLVLVALLLLSLAGGALAHAFLDGSDPDARASISSDALERVTLSFTEPIETRFSDLRVYRLELDEAVRPTDLANVTEREFMRVNAIAAAFATRARAEGLEEGRLDRGLLTTARTTATVEIALRDAGVPAADDGERSALEPGVYVVVWEVLSIDTHWTTGHLVFFVTT
jgi:copper resistance protein C